MALAGAGGLAGANDCRAQGVEALGVRALGMGGAFVAVADDATATYWNPAGLATAGIVSVVIEHGRQGSGESDAPAFTGAQGGSATFVGLTVPPLGLGYYRLRTTRLLPPAAAAGASGLAGAASAASAGVTGVAVAGGIAPGDRGLATSLVTQHVGVTLIQSIGDILDVAGTIKYVHGSAAIAFRDATLEGAGAFDRAASLMSAGSGTVDVDLGALAHVGQFRAGLVVRNLREPSFDAPSPSGSGLPDALRLNRQVRAGVAWQSVKTPTTVSCDIDLTRTETALDVQRHLAVGAEHQFAPRLVVRGGFRVNTLDDARPAGAAGVSVGVRSSIWVDAQVTHGSSLADRGWGLSARFGF
jgi:hypothetical protein